MSTSCNKKDLIKEVPRVPGGYDPNAWGKSTWDLNLLMAFLAQRGGEHGVFWARVFFACITRTLACEPCRRFELHCWAIDNPMDRPPSELLDWLYDLRTIVSTKVHGPAALAAMAPRQALRRRLHTSNSVGIDPSVVCASLMIMALRIGSAPLDDEERNLRATALYFMAVAVAHVLIDDATHYRIVGCFLLKALHAVTSVSETPTWSATFGASYAAHVNFVKVNKGTPRSLEETVAAMQLQVPLHKYSYPDSIVSTSN